MIDKGILNGNWETTPDGHRKLKTGKLNYNFNPVTPHTISQPNLTLPNYAGRPTQTPSVVNASQPDNSGSEAQIGAPIAALPVQGVSDQPQNSGILGELEKHNLYGQGQLTNDITNTLGVDPTGLLAGGLNYGINQGISTLTGGFPGNPLASVINGKVVEAPWGDNFNVGAPGTLSGKIGQSNYDDLKEIYGYTNPAVVDTPEATFTDDAAAQLSGPDSKYDFNIDPATDQVYGFKPGPLGLGQVAQGNLPEGVTTKAESDAYLAEQANNAAAKAQYIQDNGITENPDGSYTYANGYTTNVTDSKGIPSAPSQNYLDQIAAEQQAAIEAKAAAEAEAAAQAKAEQDAKDAHAAQVAANLAAQQAAAEKAAQDAADAAAAEAAAQAAKQAAYQAQVDAQNNDDNHGGQTDGSQTGSETSHGGGYGGYADDTASSNDGGGGGGGGGTWCCTAARDKGAMTNYQITKLRKWHKSQSKIWQSGYDTWGKIIADNLVAKCSFFADLTKSFYEWKVNGKFTLKSALAWKIIVPMSMIIGCAKEMKNMPMEVK